ncbi:MAG TPA: tetratricopeptide repeat protein, partial [Verrucomicrobiae bacterium]|nr:tetratricopeptide repeat protein [Verrucomicrobiae bacterium]
ANAKALVVLKRAEAFKPSDPKLQLRLADGFNLLGASDKATQAYSALLKQLPPEAPMRDQVRAKLADIYLRGSDRQHAREQLEAIIHDDPGNALAYYYLGNIALDQNQMEKAADYFSKTILFQPDFGQAYYDLANAQLSLKKPSLALDTLEQARKRFSQNFVLEYLTAVAESMEKHYEEAIKHFTAAEVVARATNPERLTGFFYFQVGGTYERKGDYAQAEKYLEKSLQLQPDFPAAMNYLGFMWAEHGMKLERARELIAKAVKADPGNSAYLDSMAWVLYKMNQPKAALEYMLKAMANMEEPDATMYDHLGDIYAALHEPVKAHDAWHKSANIAPNAEVEKKLKA